MDKSLEEEGLSSLLFLKHIQALDFPSAWNLLPHLPGSLPNHLQVFA